MTPTGAELDTIPAPAFAQRIETWQRRIEAVLDHTLGEPDAPTERLRQAMRYAVLGGGKRLRPILVYVTGAALGAQPQQLDAPAAAVELIHAYSLIHDDLPAMDDDDLRRGRPTCHRAFDEGTAILAGDALQALAFDVLARGTAGLPDSARVAMLATLASAIGTGGMAGGQAIDIAAVGRRLGPADIEVMHRRKTGALIAASVELGALASGCTAGERLEALRHFGAEIGLAFQIQDDILDVTGETSVLGKKTGADQALGKPTYPSILGLERARTLAARHRDQALAALAPLGVTADTLRELGAFVVDRVH
ncbi:MAG: (2E,6E)-farnesyl diphosphate synthase [Gammaproteobacteria bacterium]|nr:(2E,6E)-farnesyl diphosphate synthase [Gammaproteobacteria bacterium]